MNEPRNIVQAKLDEIARLRKAGKFEDAIAVCNEIIKDDEECYMAYSKRSDIFHALGMQQEAFSDLDKLMLIRPECPSAYYVRAKWNLELGNDDAAVEDANFVINTGDYYFMDTAYFFRTIAFLNLGDKEKAAKDCQMLPEDFKMAVTVRKFGWKVLSRDDLHKMIAL